jgi:acetolactate synthase I/II/III large subunit
LVSRAIVLATSEPQGPVYLSLPREPLMAPIEPGQLQPVAIEKLAGWIAAADAPVILVQRSDPAGKLSALLQDFAYRHAIAVAEPSSVRNVVPSVHPMFIGHDPKSVLAGADLIIVLDCDIPGLRRSTAAFTALEAALTISHHRR